MKVYRAEVDIFNFANKKTGTSRVYIFSIGKQSYRARPIIWDDGESGWVVEGPSEPEHKLEPVDFNSLSQNLKIVILDFVEVEKNIAARLINLKGDE